jgi:uncharacterized membrane protein YfcA
MTVLAFTLILLAGAYLAGLVGSLTGRGGVSVIIPLLNTKGRISQMGVVVLIATPVLRIAVSLVTFLQ